MAEDGKNLFVGGYRFYTEKDAQLAATELKKIDYLEERIDYSKPDSILMVYEKSIHERIFRTPVGFQYLKGLRDYLLDQPGIEPARVPAIPLYSTFSGEVREKGNPARNRIKDQEGKSKDSGFKISVILNVLLVLAVIAMFTITLRSDNPNVLNYERALTNRYAQWEQELTERENAVREKERELKINGNTADFTE